MNSKTDERGRFAKATNLTWMKPWQVEILTKARARTKARPLKVRAGICRGVY